MQRVERGDQLHPDGQHFVSCGVNIGQNMQAISGGNRGVSAFIAS